MRLSAQVVFEGLEGRLGLRSMGALSQKPTLKRARLVDGSEGRLGKDYLYIATAGMLPARPRIEQGTTILVLGGSIPLHYQGKACCLVSDEHNLYLVFELVQSLFDTYNEWEQGLQDVLDMNGDVQEMVDRSLPIFQNPIMVLDAGFSFVAFSEGAAQSLGMSEGDVQQGARFPQEMLASSMRAIDSNMSTSETIILRDRQANRTTCSRNLFNRGKLAGNVYVVCCERPFRPGDTIPLKVLSRMLEKALSSDVKRYDRSDPRLSMLRSILDGTPFDFFRLAQTSLMGQPTRYVCAVIVPTDMARLHIPTEYVLSQFEHVIEGIAILEHDASFVALVPVSNGQEGEEGVETTLREQMESMSLRCGLSLPFRDLAQTMVYLRQANHALETGGSQDQNALVYPFRNYLLPYMLSQSTGDLPFESVLFAGLPALIEHDRTSDTSYVRTLKVYLDNSLSITKTARDLYVHRSTLISRLQRIDRILGVDLGNPEQRLCLEMIIARIGRNGRPGVGQPALDVDGDNNWDTRLIDD